MSIPIAKFLRAEIAAEWIVEWWKKAKHVESLTDYIIIKITRSKNKRGTRSPKDKEQEILTVTSRSQDGTMISPVTYLLSSRLSAICTEWSSRQLEQSDYNHWHSHLESLLSGSLSSILFRVQVVCQWLNDLLLDKNRIKCDHSRCLPRVSANEAFKHYEFERDLCGDCGPTRLLTVSGVSLHPFPLCGCRRSLLPVLVFLFKKYGNVSFNVRGNFFFDMTRACHAMWILTRWLSQTNIPCQSYFSITIVIVGFSSTSVFQVVC